MFRTVLFLTILIACTFTIAAGAVIVEGTITDAVSGEPISRVTIRVEGTGQTMLGNDDGRYRLRLDPGTHSLRFSHVAHYSRTLAVTVADRPETLDVVLQPSIIELPGTRVYTRAYDPAQEIILEAIAHKKALLERIHDYSFDAYTKLSVRKIEDTAVGNYLLIVESQLHGYFEKPDHFKEIITARKQSSNLKAEENLITVGRMFNFNENRIDIGHQAIVTPTATDALNFYNYYLLDTTLVDGRPAFRLELEPKNQADPLFQGEILIADTTFEVVGVDVGFNEGLDAPFIKNPRFSQRFARFENDIWWPVEVRFSGDVSFPLPGLPDMTFRYAAALNQMAFNAGIPNGTFDEFVLEVAPEADKVDSTTWLEGALIPLTVDEQEGYRHIDSVEHLPPSFKKIALGVTLGTLMLLESSQYYDIFHFTGVEGPYLGAGYNFRNIIKRTDLSARTGWAFDGEYWQHRYWIRHRFESRSRPDVSAEFHDQIVPRPTVFTSTGFNPTLVELWAKVNPLDYYLEKGFRASASFTPVRHTRLYAGFQDYNQYTVRVATNYGFFDDDKVRRRNAPIVNGHLRSVSLLFEYESSPLVKAGDVVYTQLATTRTNVALAFEAASPDFVDNDFDYRRYYLRVERHQRLGGLGVVHLFGLGGLSDRGLPPQRYFTIDIGDQDNIQQTNFKTLDETNFVGDRVLVLYASHNFGLSLFRKSGLPLIRMLPLSFFIYGGTFWSDFREASLKVDGYPAASAPDGYSELGFGLGRIPPIYMQLYFTWQLSAYDTNDFSVKFSLGF